MYIAVYQQFETAPIFPFVAYSAFPSYLKLVFPAYVKSGSRLVPTLKKKLRFDGPSRTMGKFYSSRYFCIYFCIYFHLQTVCCIPHSLTAGACPGDVGAHSVTQDLYLDVTSSWDHQLTDVGGPNTNTGWQELQQELQRR